MVGYKAVLRANCLRAPVNTADAASLVSLTRETWGLHEPVWAGAAQCALALPNVTWSNRAAIPNAVRLHFGSGRARLLER